LEDLEMRMVLAASTVAPGAGDVLSVVMQPTLQIYQSPSGGAGDQIPGQHGSLAQSLGAVASGGFTPQQIRTAYAIDQIGFGTTTGDGTGETIAIVDAYDDPNLVDSTSPNFKNSDLAEFDTRFGLPDPPSFEKLGQDGSANLPGVDPTGEWEVEAALDVEWAHAIAPGASIVLIECNSGGLRDLLDAGARTAASLPGVSVVSMSFGSSEFASEQSFDGDFTTPSGHQGVTFVASTGDCGSPGEYPACSPSVMAIGGTSLYVNGDNTYQSEAGWSGSGGGTSAYESEPTFQQGVQSTGKRAIPDVAFDADPNTGVQIYDSYDQANPCFQMGGTSLAVPCWAGLIAIADQGRAAAGGTTLDGPSQTLPALYSLPSGDFHDIPSGSNGADATPGYDMVTGLGSPNADLLVSDLAAYQLPAQLAGTSYQTPTQLAVISQLPSSVTAGNPFALTVAAEDGSGNVESSFNGLLTVALEAGPHGGLLSGDTTMEAVNGVATFSNLTLDTAGTGYSLEVTGGGLTPATVTALSVAPAAAAQLVVTAQPPTSMTAGSSFGVAVAVVDRFGNLVPSYNGGVTVALGVNPSAGTLYGTLTVTASQGVAAFWGLTIFKAGAGYSLQISGGGLAPALTPPLNVAPAAAARLVVTSGPPTPVIAASSFRLTAAVEDSYGNAATSYNGNVIVVLAGNHGRGRLRGTLIEPTSSGVVSFSNLIVSTVGKGYTLTVSGGGLSAATTPAFNVSLAPRHPVKSPLIHTLKVRNARKTKPLAVPRVGPAASAHQRKKR
jgi:hypothetical protein